MKLNIPKHIKYGKDNETGIEALNRLKRVIDYSEQFNRYNRTLHSHYEPVFFRKKITNAEIVKAEQRLGIKFPDSYIRFIKEYGFFRIGNGWGNTYRKLLTPSKIVTLSDYFREEFVQMDYTDKEDEYNEYIVTLLGDTPNINIEKIYPFTLASYLTTDDDNPTDNDETFYCFNFASATKDNEVEIVRFRLFAGLKETDKKLYTFDDYIIEIVDLQIKLLEIRFIKGKYDK